VSFSAEDRSATDFAEEARRLLQKGDGDVARFSKTKSREVVAAGYVPDHDRWYQPKDESIHEHLFRVPEGRFHVVQMYVNAYIFKSISELAPTRWAIDDQGRLTPTLMLKKTKWGDKASSDAEPFAPETNAAHRKMSDREDAGENLAVASLQLTPKASTAQK
jgi:hypothetical protein